MLNIWPLINKDTELISHDSFHCLEYPSTKAWPTQRKGPADMATYRSVATSSDGTWTTERAIQYQETLAKNEDELMLARPANLSESELTQPLLKGGKYELCPVECRPPQHASTWVHC